METTTIPVQRREKVGRRAAQHLRKEGYVLGVLYGHGEENIPLAMPLKTIEHSLKMNVRIIQLDFGDDTVQALIKDIQWDSLGDRLLHVDLLRVRMDEEVSMSIPLESQGRAKGIEEGGLLEVQRSELQIKCLPTKVPSTIIYDVSDLGVGESIHIKDIPLPDGVTLDEDPDQVVVSLVVKVEAPPPEEEAPAEGEEGEAPPEEGEQAEEKESKEDKGE
jgi:large subunit ribosomal protein L25